MTRPAPVAVALVVALIAIAIGPRARADVAEALDLAKRAEARIAEGDRRGAIEFLQGAYRADPAPTYLLSIGQQWEAIAKDESDASARQSAIDAYRRYVSVETDLARVAEVEVRIRQLQGYGESPLPGPPGRVEVRFQANKGDGVFHVSISGEHCTTPCALLVAPGAYVVTTTGADRLRLSLYVAESAGTVTLTPSGDRFLLPGAILTAAGGVVAAAFWSFSEACPIRLDLAVTECQVANQALWPVLGGVALFTGIGFLGYYATHRREEADYRADEAEEEPRGHSRLRLASVGLQASPGGGGASLGFTF